MPAARQLGWKINMRLTTKFEVQKARRDGMNPSRPFLDSRILVLGPRSLGWPLLIFCGLLFTGCSRPQPAAPVRAGAAQDPSSSSPAPASPSPNASLQPQPLPPSSTATKAAAEDEFVASGPIVVENQVDVAAQREGVVSTLNADVGTMVHRGQLLATLDSRQQGADQDALKARVRSIAADVKNWEAETRVAEADRDRAEGMWKSQLITKQDLDHARYKTEASKFEVDRERENLRNAEAMLRSSQLEGAKARIVAPFTGVVARRYVRLGQKVARDDRLFYVSATGPLRVKFMLPERYLDRVHMGTFVEVVPVSLPGRQSRARIVLVSPVVDPSSGAVEMVAELIAPSQELRPGMTARIALDKGPTR